jgi:phosphonate transport system permease protein
MYKGTLHGRTIDSAGWWAYSWKMFSTQFIMLFEVCFLGTFLGCIFSIPLYYLCSRNVVHSPWIYQTTRIINDVLRTIPMFMTCMFINQFFGTGNTIDGVLAIAFFTAGIMYQMMYEYIETLEMSPFEAVRSCGGTNLQCINLGLHPEIKPMFFAYSIYTLEINIRASVILSYVGFGGFVKILIDNIDQGYYDYAGAMLLPLFLIVIVLQFVSNTLVRKLR